MGEEFETLLTTIRSLYQGWYEMMKPTSENIMGAMQSLTDTSPQVPQQQREFSLMVSSVENEIYSRLADGSLGDQEVKKLVGILCLGFIIKFPSSDKSEITEFSDRVLSEVGMRGVPALIYLLESKETDKQHVATVLSTITKHKFLIGNTKKKKWQDWWGKNNPVSQ